MEDKLKYKRIALNDSKSKTIENIYNNGESLLMTFSDKTYSYVIFNHTLKRFEEKVLSYGDIIEDHITYQAFTAEPVYSRFVDFLISFGIIDKEDVHEDSKKESEALLKRNNESEINTYKFLKRKYEGSSN